ncbi:MAG: hypothetical protein ACJ788_13910, partial [Ktedonobacteraceae bacterium]
MFCTLDGWSERRTTLWHFDTHVINLIARRAGWATEAKGDTAIGQRVKEPSKTMVTACMTPLRCLSPAERKVLISSYVKSFCLGTLLTMKHLMELMTRTAQPFLQCT